MERLRATAGMDGIPVDGETPGGVLDALSDDLNTPSALAHVFELVADLNKAGGDSEKQTLKGRLVAAGNLLGLLQQDPEDWFRWQPADAETVAEDEIESLIAERLSRPQEPRLRRRRRHPRRPGRPGHRPRGRPRRHHLAARVRPAD